MQYSDKYRHATATQGDHKDLREPLAISTSLWVHIQQHLRQASSVTPCVLCVCTCLHMCQCYARQADQWCWSWEHLTQQSESHSGGEKHIVSSLPACLTHSAVMLILLVSMATARCEGSAGKWPQWRFYRQSPSIPCHGNSDRRWMYKVIGTQRRFFSW